MKNFILEKTIPFQDFTLKVNKHAYARLKQRFLITNEEECGNFLYFALTLGEILDTSRMNASFIQKHRCENAYHVYVKELSSILIIASETVNSFFLRTVLSADGQLNKAKATGQLFKDRFNIKNSWIIGFSEIEKKSNFKISPDFISDYEAKKPLVEDLAKKQLKEHKAKKSKKSLQQAPSIFDEMGFRSPLLQIKEEEAENLIKKKEIFHKINGLLKEKDKLVSLLGLIEKTSNYRYKDLASLIGASKNLQCPVKASFERIESFYERLGSWCKKAIAIILLHENELSLDLSNFNHRFLSSEIKDEVSYWSKSFSERKLKNISSAVKGNIYA